MSRPLIPPLAAGRRPQRQDPGLVRRLGYILPALRPGAPTSGRPPQAAPRQSPFLANRIPIPLQHTSSAESISSEDSYLDDIFLNNSDSEEEAREEARGIVPQFLAKLHGFETCSVGAREEGDSCPICLKEWENDEMAKKLPCKHIFHFDCLRDWLKLTLKCPLCKVDL